MDAEEGESSVDSRVHSRLARRATPEGQTRITLYAVSAHYHEETDEARGEKIKEHVRAPFSSSLIFIVRAEKTLRAP